MVVLTVNRHVLYTKLLLRQVHTIQVKQFDGDYGAVVMLTDLETAIKYAKLTDKQKRVLRLVYTADLTQAEAGRYLGISQQAVDVAINGGVRKIAKIYEGWTTIGSENK